MSNVNTVTRFGIEIDLSKVGKIGCPRCIKNGKDHSHNNFHVYGLDDEGRHKGGVCWSCQYTIPSMEYVAANTKFEYTEEYEFMGQEFNREIAERLKEGTGVETRGYRGIRTDISKYFGVRYQYSETDGSIEKVFYPCTKGYKLSGYKVRTHPKDFRNPLGETGKNCELFGQHRFKNQTNKTCVVVSGEHDQLAAYQMLSDYFAKRGYEEMVAVVSSTIGETGGAQQMLGQYDWFMQFEKIIYVPDGDEAGQKACNMVAEVLPKGKMYVMRLPAKDCNQMLDDGREKEFISAFYNAALYSPDGVVGSSELSAKMRESASLAKIPLPPFMHKAQSLMAGGVPLGRIINIGAASGAGKSTIADECVYFWIFNSPYKIGVVSLESDAGEYGLKLLSRHIGRKIDLIEDDDEKMAFLDDPVVREREVHLLYKDGENRFHLVDERDGGVNSLKKAVETLVVKCACRVIILDPLQDILDGLNDSEQAVFLKWQKGLVKSHKVTFININHIRKSSGGDRANSTGANIHEEDFHGSSTIFKSAACNLLFTRNKEAENPLERNTTYMKMTKCRWTGRTDPQAGKYFYDNETHTMWDFDDYISANPHLVAF